ncbi:hypothetical protein MKZ08_08285 [Viridibacillus sp. FSL R5-0477]|uniref:Uncharacterized protein n=1 Tax=Viridibacillus arenosi FSL R5-213 TaxID=1227360 RepID=W4EUK7_9BACL|nr:hypothetical protein [Viridibacillus arenosi]ETT84208.1 hypothetical protein C176_12608 [Viridibacillus arenosi FSL R5-213]OMC89999.1 hypothetical protein BK137_14720 [Viridibacillus arenosi]
MFTNVESTELISSVENIMVELKKRLDPSYVEAQKKAEVDGDNVIQHKGLKLCKVEREAREGDYVRPNYQGNFHVLRDGEIYGPVFKDKGERLAVSSGYTVYEDAHNRTPSTVEVFEPIGHCKPVEYEPPFPEVLTPNEQRALLIKQAKEFVEEHTKPNDFTGKGVLIGSRWSTKIEFVLNNQKRTLVALAKGIDSARVRAKGIAKCAPDEVFNEHIGQAIALARALEIEVPKGFLKAIQPDEKVAGMVVFAEGEKRRLVIEYKDVNISEHHGEITCQVGSGYSKEGIILDDTKAEYNNA